MKNIIIGKQRITFQTSLATHRLAPFPMFFLVFYRCFIFFQYNLYLIIIFLNFSKLSNEIMVLNRMVINISRLLAIVWRYYGRYHEHATNANDSTNAGCRLHAQCSISKSYRTCARRLRLPSITASSRV